LTADLADLGHRLDYADLVVGVHYADERRVGEDRIAKLIEVDESVAFRCQHGYAAARFGEAVGCVQHRFMLGANGHKMPTRPHNTFEGQIVAFGGAAGENNLIWECAAERGDTFSRKFDGALSVPSKAMRGAGRVAEFGAEIGQHGVQYAFIHG